MMKDVNVTMLENTQKIVFELTISQECHVEKYSDGSQKFFIHFNKSICPRSMSNSKKMCNTKQSRATCNFSIEISVPLPVNL